MIKLSPLLLIASEVVTTSVVNLLIVQLVDQMAKYKALHVSVVVNTSVMQDNGPVSVQAKRMLVEAVVF